MTEKFLITPGGNIRSSAEAGQDVFAYEANHREVGTFVDIGCNHPTVHNNSYALELAGWNGICVDIEHFDYSGRKTPFIRGDATTVLPALHKFIQLHRGRITYLSLDTDDACFDCLERLVPFYRFRAITIEHDVYRVGPGPKQRIYEFLTTHLAYERAFEDVLAPETPGQPWSNQPFEDWYLLPETLAKSPLAA
jgi:hypothetical protein